MAQHTQAIDPDTGNPIEMELDPESGELRKVGAVSAPTPTKLPVDTGTKYSGIFSGNHPFIELLPQKAQNSVNPHTMEIVTGVDDAIDSAKNYISDKLDNPILKGAASVLGFGAHLGAGVLNDPMGVGIAASGRLRQAVGAVGDLLGSKSAVKAGEEALPKLAVSHEPTIAPKPVEAPIEAMPSAHANPTIIEPQGKLPLTNPVEQHPAVSKLLDAMESAKPLNKEQQLLYQSEKAAKVAKVKDVQSTGEQGFYDRLAALKGEHTKVEMEPLRPKLEQDDVDSLFTHIQQAPIGDEFTKINASSGLRKLLEGAVPQDSELRALSKTIGKDAVNRIDAMLPEIDRKQSLIGEAVNLPRSLMSSIDFSAPLRQGLPLIGKKSWWTSLDDMFKSWGSEKAYRGVIDSIESHPNFDFSQETGLRLTDLTHLSNREEQFMSTWAEKLPGVRASNRAYVGFLNKLRFDTFNDLITKAEAAGLNPKQNEVLAHTIADFINTATGRGSLGKLEKNAVMLNNMFFSPRLIASRVKMLNPVYYAKLDPFTRKEALKAFFNVVAAGSTFTGLAKLAGADVEMDPRSSDFGKAKIGNVRLDPFGGFQQYIVAASRLISGQSKSPNSGDMTDLTEGAFGRPTRLDIVGRFAESKANPIVGLGMAFLRGKEITGEPFSLPSVDSPLKNSIANRFLPMFVQDVRDLAEEDPALIPLAIPSAFGMSNQVFSDSH